MSSDDGWHGSVVLVLGSATGGTGGHVLSLARGLVAAGCRVLVCGPAANDEHYGFTAAGVDYVPVEIPADPGPQDTGAVRALRRAVLGHEAQVVHAHGLRAGFVASLARTGVPLVVTWHNAVLAKGLRGQAGALVERIVARNAALTLGASEDLVDRAVALGARKARLGPVAAPEMRAPKRTRKAVRAEFGIKGDTPLILSVGRLHPQKHYDLLVDASARWRDLDPAPVVVVAGSGPSYMPLAQRASREHAPFHLLGHRGDVPDLLLGADLAVVTSDWEARQLFAQEALRAGVPLVTTAVGGLPGLVGDAAVLIPPGDLDALDRAVRDLLNDPEQRADLAARGPVQAATWPDEKAVVDAVRAGYAEVSAA
ncbi:glycosyltransferase involved in cell wall biosynthesis [Actinoplanes octamycinicus]|uniref:Glycosyltransferase involved in cell wall biosynthesis n=1 Tax=Actinoplanes octamycinicus TaxID=135948 RepID=A0A7W7H7K2_9ACTN|nr:glycosyltransferase family 4 protein [Actinoplanes octamycinicus]MBB4745334.1 glycosyltransferase involved in cell wall biosynthesis [Actinoplanes octamycinicus]GIE62186.1 glycosyl transferase [Actinoplanes octamycinicus]